MKKNNSKLRLKYIYSDCIMIYNIRLRFLFLVLEMTSQDEHVTEIHFPHLHDDDKGDWIDSHIYVSEKTLAGEILIENYNHTSMLIVQIDIGQHCYDPPPCAPFTCVYNEIHAFLVTRCCPKWENRHLGSFLQKYRYVAPINVCTTHQHNIFPRTRSVYHNYAGSMLGQHRRR